MFAVLLAGADLPAAHALGLDRVSLLDPVADVDVVDVLLADMVAAEPGEEVPVADLVLQLGEILPRGTGVLAGGRCSSSNASVTMSPISPSWMRSIASWYEAS